VSVHHIHPSISGACGSGWEARMLPLTAMLSAGFFFSLYDVMMMY